MPLSRTTSVPSLRTTCPSCRWRSRCWGPGPGLDSSGQGRIRLISLFTWLMRMPEMLRMNRASHDYSGSISKMDHWIIHARPNVWNVHRIAQGKYKTVFSLANIFLLVVRGILTPSWLQQRHDEQEMIHVFCVANKTDMNGRNSKLYFSSLFMIASVRT